MLRFGTDGIRGKANQELTMEVGYWLGVGIAKAIQPPAFAIGRDTRESGYWLAHAVGLGIASLGIDIIDCGVLPTGALSWVARSLALPTVVISASHNPYFDNGIKVFDADGAKISANTERGIEGYLAEFLEGKRPFFGPLGGVDQRSFEDSYVDWVLTKLGVIEHPLRVVIDGANGAAWRLGPHLATRMGAEVVATIGDKPDGRNINAGVGALHPDVLASVVVQHQADLGLCFDGDADRLIAVSESGAIVDGDELLTMFALYLQRRGALAHDSLAVTIMSNLGIERALEPHAISVVRTDVGDRQIATAMTRDQLSLGGEQSGHIIVKNLGPTGDGLVSGALLLHALSDWGGSLDRFRAEEVVRYPQVHRQVRTQARDRIILDPDFMELRADLEAELGSEGRLVLRPSGTEPVFRILVEAADISVATRLAEQLVTEVEAISRRLTTV
ncbi:hypothetical protein [Ferrimicrobium acidiphilum]|uniref:hypothetical protein n=1 Tax=Ferrimicrobium acidiphilum TaxID=121039 RepID=UPI0023EFE59D|nr:hypothetical protein [Ferrimicrobium acidiphilum]